jgi:hypothetical protein
MEDVLAVLGKTPLPIFLAAAGILLILVAALSLSRGRRTGVGLIGLLLLALAFAVYVYGTPVTPGIEEVIQITAPVPGAQVKSPVQVTGVGGPAFEGTLVIEVYGEDGTLVGEGIATIQTEEMGGRGPFQAQVAFSVETDQQGRVSVFMTSPRDGRIEHLSSVNVFLVP